MSHIALPEARMPAKGMPLHIKVLLGFIAGAVLGLFAHFIAPGSPFVLGAVSYVAQPIGQIFLALLFMLVLPLMFSALVLGVAELGDVASLGRLGWRTLIYTAVVTLIAVAIGLVMVNLIAPGQGLDRGMLDQAMAQGAQKAGEIAATGQQLDFMKMLLGIVPKNVLAAAVDDKQKLGVMFFALMLGIGLVMTPSPHTQAFKNAVQGLFEICMRLIGMIIKLAPYAVACLMFALCAQFGWELLLVLGKFALTVVLAIAVHMFIVLPLWVKFAGGMSPRAFFRGSQEALLTAFATASSTGTLPVTLRVAEQNLKLPRKVARFVLTVGASANHHGTALFEGITVLFLAQAFGVELTLMHQVMVLGLCLLGGIGTAGVPAGSLPVIAMICAVLGIPAEGVGIILGVDRFLDMCRTALNVTGDLATAVVVANRSGDVAESEVVMPAETAPEAAG
ncbi:dicarboxylate/amino acid:cation symporter [Lysobacter soli]|uniref:dicarboxylate/amino acid:cation symporter n=1 Tax=Lysobacter soli TaxID=453783 RepID=UPI0036B67030